MNWNKYPVLTTKTRIGILRKKLKQIVLVGRLTWFLRGAHRHIAKTMTKGYNGKIT